MQSDEVLPGVIEFLEELKQKGIKIGLGSASKNAPRILDAVGLRSYFEALIDGSRTTKGKPDPQVFQMGAKELSVEPTETIVFEDAPKGVQAALTGGFWAVGIGEKEHLGAAHHIMPGFDGIKFNALIKKL